MTPLEDLHKQIEDLLRPAAVRLERERRTRHDAMKRWDDRSAALDDRVRRWMGGIILPRFSVLAGAFSNAEPPKHSESALRASVHFAKTDDFPADARVEARLVHDATFEKVQLIFEVSIIPILMEYEREGSLNLEVARDDALALESFMEDRIVRFVSDYVRVGDPDSPYQRGVLVTDPVCGMTLRRVDAEATCEHEGRKYYFCVTRCRELFAADPERYSRTAFVRQPAPSVERDRPA